ncbi:unnamed protein product [Strongylus vulgaris]|uniref:Uncharacterized protein n=1 Tax=Strongylus vulgaris TaxID=40348 RepID=A0A3P7IND2_STRVU|nr:unnamed protein product [Strongylus vulgaris]
MERIPTVILLCLVALCTFAYGQEQQVNAPNAPQAVNAQPVQAQQVPQQQQQQQQPPPQPAVNAQPQQQQGGETLLSFDACKEDIHRLCNKEGVDLKSDLSILECLQDAGQTMAATLTRQCEDLVWQFKVGSLFMKLLLGIPCLIISYHFV